MEYHAPFGSPDPNASYVDRNTPGATRGSTPPAAAIEHPQREIMAVITAAGLAPSGADLTQLLQAIQNLISAATGGSGDPNYVLMTQARARLPIFPEVLTSDGALPIVSPSTGQVRVPAGYNFLHRGIYAVTTVQADFATSASKTYHLRWNPTSGFQLKDLADSSYNPSFLMEANAGFDSTYDDMLVARVVTNASNVATITNLINKSRLFNAVLVSESFTRVSSATGGGNWTAPFSAIALNWARTPKATGHAARVGYNGELPHIPEEPLLMLSGSSTDGTGTATASVSRYAFQPLASIDINDPTVSRTFAMQLSALLMA